MLYNCSTRRIKSQGFGRNFFDEFMRLFAFEIWRFVLDNEIWPPGLSAASQQKSLAQRRGVRPSGCAHPARTGRARGRHTHRAYSP